MADEPLGENSHEQVDRMTRFWLSDENNIPTKVFTIGSTIFIQGRGLHPYSLYDFHLCGESKEGTTTLLARYSTDRHGALLPTALIPCAGVFKHDGVYPQSDADARRETAGRTFIIRAESRGNTGHDLENLNFAVMPLKHSRWIFSCDASGQLQTSIEQRSGPISIALRNFPAGCVRVSLVPRQSRWRVGDPIVPVSTRGGSICRRVFHHDGSAERIVKFAQSDDIPAGSYQFVARSFQLGWNEAGETAMLADDVVSDRQFASLVIRLPFDKRFGHDDGVLLTPENAGPLVHWPQFKFVRRTPIGTEVSAARHPASRPSDLAGKRAEIYDIRQETAPRWSVVNAC
jgi:hypothetical protein